MTVSKNDAEVRYAYEGETPEDGPFTATGLITNGRSTFDTTRRDTAGNDRFYRLSIESDGTSTIEFNSARLFTYTLSFTATQSGTGIVKDLEGATIATLTWNENGDGVLTFEDQSTVPFANFQFETLP